MLLVLIPFFLLSVTKCMTNQLEEWSPGFHSSREGVVEGVRLLVTSCLRPGSRDPWMLVLRSSSPFCSVWMSATHIDHGPSYFNEPNLETLSQTSSGVCLMDDSRFLSNWQWVLMTWMKELEKESIEHHPSWLALDSSCFLSCYRLCHSQEQTLEGEPTIDQVAAWSVHWLPSWTTVAPSLSPSWWTGGWSEMETACEYCQYSPALGHIQKWNTINYRISHWKYIHRSGTYVEMKTFSCNVFNKNRNQINLPRDG